MTNWELYRLVRDHTGPVYVEMRAHPDADIMSVKVVKSDLLDLLGDRADDMPAPWEVEINGKYLDLVPRF